MNGYRITSYIYVYDEYARDCRLGGTQRRCLTLFATAQQRRRMKSMKWADKSHLNDTIANAKRRHRNVPKTATCV